MIMAMTVAMFIAGFAGRSVEEAVMRGSDGVGGGKWVHSRVVRITEVTRAAVVGAGELGRDLLSLAGPGSRPTAEAEAVGGRSLLVAAEMALHEGRQPRHGFVEREVRFEHPHLVRFPFILDELDSQIPDGAEAFGQLQGRQGCRHG
ncbi:hypothetical protein BCEP4_120040 [Burkholderia cepacia]|nr:hypothetical protein BCEP4_120040 [Burkholderia cepacia]